MNEESVTTRINFLLKEYKLRIKDLLFWSFTIFILSSLVVGLAVYFALNNLYLNEKKLLDKQITDLRNQVEILQEKERTNSFSISTVSDKSLNNDPTYNYIDNPEITTCDFWKDKTYGKVSTDIERNTTAGTLSVKGTVIQRIEDAAWAESKKVTKVYFVFSSPTNDTQQIFYDNYVGLVNAGNSVNDLEGKQLLFNIGSRVNSNLISDSYVSDELKSRIVSAIDKSEIINLKLTIPIYGGRSVDDNFSYACEIAE